MISTISTPRINANDQKIQLVQWHVQDGTYVERGQEIADLETSKAVVTVTAEAEGIIRCLGRAGDIIGVGSPLYQCGATQAELDAAAGATAAPGAAPAHPAKSHAGTRFSRPARELLRQRGLSEADFPHAGLVTARALARGPAPAVARHAAAPSWAAELPPGPPAARSENSSLGKLAEIDSLRSGESGNINSMLSVSFNSAPIRARLARDQAFDGNIQPLILYELSRLLKLWPQFTAYFDDGRVHFFDRIDLGIAIDLGNGLKVVTLREADKLLPVEFFEKTLDCGMRYLENRIKPEELVGSTLTVTDLSGLDILYFHPLINGRQSAILGIGGDRHLAGHPMSLIMTFDHRVSNGREVATFLGDLRARLLSYGLADEAPEAEFDTLPAPEDEPEAPAPLEAPAAFEAPVAPAAPIVCDRCSVELTAYYAEHPRDGLMRAYFRADGTMGSICHCCAEGWI